jgi:hypothetical protein
VHWHGDCFLTYDFVDFYNKQQQQGRCCCCFLALAREEIAVTDEAKPTLAELTPQNVIRVETAMSRYPVHRLARQRTNSIEIREESPDGETLIKWDVSPSVNFGQPGPLAYKIDTLIVNRRIEEASRPIPKIIKLGSLRDICEELGISEGKNRDNVKNALRQNASAFITAKISYRNNDGSERTLEADFNRYSVVFTGEELPNGRKANSVYIVLNEIFMQVLDGAQTRPLDYDYLKELNPSAQRLYEILSYRIYAAIRNDRPHAKLDYSELCTYAPLSRHENWKSVSWQMSRIHAPHQKSGYIASVKFQETVDRNGKPDWTMIYTPGNKAREEYRTFSRQGGPRTLYVDHSGAGSRAELPSLGAVQVFEVDAYEVRQPSPLERELIARGISEHTAAQLVASYPAERIESQIERFDWSKDKAPRSIAKNDGGFLAEAIRKNYPMPNGFESKADREKRQAEEKLKKQQEREEAARAKAAQQREVDLDGKALERWKKMSPGERMETEAAALASAEDSVRRSYEKSSSPNFKRAFLERIRQGYLRDLIDREESASRK